MQQKGNDKAAGFGAVEILIAIVVVVIIGFIGWKVYDASKAKSNLPAQQQTSNNSGGSQADTATYLDIKELGVEVKLDDNTKTDTYTYSSTDPNGDGALIFNEAMKQVDLNNQYCKDSHPGMVGMIQRSKDAYYFSSGAKAVSVDNVTSFKIGDYYYVFAHPQAECSQDSAISQQRSAHAQDFIDVLKGIRSDK